MSVIWRASLLCWSVTVHAVSRSAKKKQPVCVCECHVIPEKSVVLNADLPQTLRSPMVGQLETYGALKLFILEEWRKRVKAVDGAEGERKEEWRESRGKDGATVVGWIVFTLQQWKNQFCFSVYLQKYILMFSTAMSGRFSISNCSTNEQSMHSVHQRFNGLNRRRPSLINRLLSN